MKYFKGFDQNLKCRGFQYAVGETYQTTDAVLCESGFHACENPLDVLNYYPPGTSRYAEVTLSDVCAKRKGEDTKVCAKAITIVRELSHKEFVAACSVYMNSQEIESQAKGNYGHASAAGYRGHASAAGNYGHASAAGEGGHASAAGYRGHASAAGNYGHASAAGEQSVAASLGIESTACAAGNCKYIVLTEYQDGKLLGVKVGEVGKDIEVNKTYCLRNGQFVETEAAKW
jgi:hypothetical protein